MIEPLILRPDESILTRYPELVKMAAELSDVYTDQEKLVTDNALQLIGTDRFWMRSRFVAEKKGWLS